VKASSIKGLQGRELCRVKQKCNQNTTSHSLENSLLLGLSQIHFSRNNLEFANFSEIIPATKPNKTTMKKLDQYIKRFCCFVV
jgi:hypothetical protein